MALRNKDLKWWGKGANIGPPNNGDGRHVFISGGKKPSMYFDDQRVGTINGRQAGWTSSSPDNDADLREFLEQKKGREMFPGNRGNEFADSYGGERRSDHNLSRSGPSDNFRQTDSGFSLVPKLDSWSKKVDDYRNSAPNREVPRYGPSQWDNPSAGSWGPSNRNLPEDDSRMSGPGGNPFGGRARDNIGYLAQGPRERPMSERLEPQQSGFKRGRDEFEGDDFEKYNERFQGRSSSPAPYSAPKRPHWDAEPSAIRPRDGPIGFRDREPLRERNELGPKEIDIKGPGPRGAGLFDPGVVCLVGLTRDRGEPRSRMVDPLNRSGDNHDRMMPSFPERGPGLMDRGMGFKDDGRNLDRPAPFRDDPPERFRASDGFIRDERFRPVDRPLDFESRPGPGDIRRPDNRISPDRFRERGFPNDEIGRNEFRGQGFPDDRAGPVEFRGRVFSGDRVGPGGFRGRGLPDDRPSPDRLRRGSQFDEFEHRRQGGRFNRDDDLEEPWRRDQFDDVRERDRSGYRSGDWPPEFRSREEYEDHLRMDRPDDWSDRQERFREGPDSYGLGPPLRRPDDMERLDFDEPRFDRFGGRRGYSPPEFDEDRRPWGPEDDEFRERYKGRIRELSRERYPSDREGGGGEPGNGGSSGLAYLNEVFGKWNSFWNKGVPQREVEPRGIGPNNRFERAGRAGGTRPFPKTQIDYVLGDAIVKGAKINPKENASVKVIDLADSMHGISLERAKKLKVLIKNWVTTFVPEGDVKQPAFFKITWSDDVVKMNCDHASQTWLEKKISQNKKINQNLWKGVKLKFLRGVAWKKAKVRIPGEANEKIKEILGRIEKQNFNIHTDRWKIHYHVHDTDANSHYFVISVDGESATEIIKNNESKLFYGLDRIFFKFDAIPTKGRK